MMGIFEIAADDLEKQRLKRWLRMLYDEGQRAMKQSHADHSFFHGRDDSFLSEREVNAMHAPYVRKLFNVDENGCITTYLDGTPLLTSICDMVLENIDDK